MLVGSALTNILQLNTQKICVNTTDGLGWVLYGNFLTNI